MGLARSAGPAGAATLASRVLGLARDQVLAAVFGAANEMDAFLVAFRIPNLLRDLFAEGAMSASFVPAFTRRLAEGGKPGAWRLGNSVLNLLTIATLALVIAGLIFARPLVTLYAADYGAVPGKLELTVMLTRIMLPLPALIVIAAVAMGMLNSLHHYFVPALAPAMFNVATIMGAIALVPLMGPLGLPAITAIAVAALVGGMGQIALQWPPLGREGFRYAPAIDWSDKALHDVMALMGPGTLGIAATQINMFVNTLLATGQGTGAVSWLGYAFRLMYLPIGLFGVSLATAVLPAVSRHASAGDVAAVRTTVARGLALMLMLNIPATLGLMVLARPIVEVLFEHGRFDASDTTATASALRFYAIGLVGYSAARIVSPVFYALRQTRFAVAASVATVALNVALGVWLAGELGFRGLALGTSLAALANGGLLVIVLRRRLAGLEGRRLAGTLVKIVVAALVMAAAAAGLDRLTAALAPEPAFAVRSVRLAVAIGGGLAALAAASKLLRIAEFDDLVQVIGERFRPAGRAPL